MRTFSKYFYANLILNCLIVNTYSSDNDDHFKIIWWTSTIPNYNEVKSCGKSKCYFTDNRELINDEKTKAILYYGSNITDFPLPRQPHHIWALLHEESPKNVPFLQHEIILKHFNFTSTFSRYSDLPLTFQYLRSLDLLISRKFFKTVKEKNEIRNKENLATIAFLQSHCDGPSGRTQYVEELMEYIEIDSYGACLNNKKLPESLTTDYLNNLYSDELNQLLAKYKFVIAFENGVCTDYVTEKLWRPLIIGSVPIYFGSPTIEDWLPNEKSAILIKNFSSPEHLANHIKYLNENDDEYITYLDHKISIEELIKNQNLISSFESMKHKYDNINIFEDMECFICEKLSNDSHSFANEKHYDCGNKLILPRMKGDMKDFHWQQIMNMGRCTAIILDEFLMRNLPFSPKEFHETMMEEFEKGFCEI